MAYTTINKSSDYFNTKLYTANGTTNHQITGVGFNPDFVWIKNRTTADGHVLFDEVRGANKRLVSSSNGAESTQTQDLLSFDSDGFTVGSNDNVNRGPSDSFASWNWKANGAGSSNTDGTITSTVSANTTAGFSIATWSGTGSNGSIGHGLGGVDCMIIKDLSNSRDFYFWQKTMAYNTRLELNNTEAFTTNTDNMTALPDATKINMAVSTQNNGNGNNYVGYFFQEKQGYSKFGSYVGNNNTDGPFIYTGFKPAFIIVKPISGVEHWTMYDNKRIGYNPTNYQLYPNLSSTEATLSELDIVSNGFKIRSQTGRLNSSGVTMIYMCFAEAPLVGTNGVTAKAR
jgi:hypothetical protein